MREACGTLAAQMAEDAEGATKVVHVKVVGARTDDEAHRAARQVAGSLLVKCSFNGEDPYWGRVVSELGCAGVAFDPDLVEIAYAGWWWRPTAWASTTMPGRLPSTWRAATSSFVATSGWAQDRAWCSRVISATATSTRTGRPRERAHHHDLSGRCRGASRRGVALHSALLRQDRRRQVRRQRPGRCADDAEAALASFAEDVVLVQSVGMLPVVVHGEGRRSGPS